MEKEPFTENEVPKDEAKESQPDRDITIKESEYKRLTKEAGEYKDKFIRAHADFENARKRLERERIEFTKYAHEGLILEFLGILDNLELSVKAAREKHEDYTAFLKGVEMVMAQIHQMLKKNGVKPIAAVGKKFDPHCHEILMQEETDQFDEGIVMEEFQKGYYLGDRVVRTTKVKLAQKKENDNE